MLVARFGILWRRLDTSLDITGKIVRACIALHNDCIRNNMPLAVSTEPGECDVGADGNMQPVFADSVATRPTRPPQGHRQTQRARRDRLANDIAAARLERPQRPNAYP